MTAEFIFNPFFIRGIIKKDLGAIIFNTHTVLKREALSTFEIKYVTVKKSWLDLKMLACGKKNAVNALEGSS